jgi:nitrate/nitrite transporter NarK
MTWFNDGRRGLAMSIRQTAIPVGGALGAALLPWLALQYGFDVVFRVLAIICLASTAATWLWLHEADGHPSAKPAASVGDERSPLFRASVWRLALASSLLTVPQIAVLAFTGVFLRDEWQVGLIVISGTLIAVQLIGGGLRIWSGQFTDRHANRRTVMRAIGLCTAVSALALALLTHTAVTVVVALVGVTGLFANAWHGVAYTEIAVMAGPKHAGTALGMEGMTIFATAFLVPLLIPHLLAVSSWTVVWAVVGGVVLLAVPVLPGQRTKF